MKIRIMAGEMARLHNINKQTLLYYDRIGLFRPESIDEETGYRYYSLEQAQVLEVILILKQFGMPLKEIRCFLDEGNTEDRIALLQEQLEMMEEKIQQLQKNTTRITGTIANLQKRKTIVPFEIGVQQQDRRLILSRKIAAPYDEYQLELAVRQLLKEEHKDEENAFFLLYGFPKEMAAEAILYSKVSLPLPAGYTEKHGNLEIIPEGRYAFYNHRGPYNTIGKSWQRLQAYIQDAGYVITGEPLERWHLDAMAVRDKDQYLVELQVAVDNPKTPHLNTL